MGVAGLRGGNESARNYPEKGQFPESYPDEPHGHATRNTKAGDRPIKLFDGDGLYLWVSPTGARGWHFNYCFGGRVVDPPGVQPLTTAVKRRAARGAAGNCVDHYGVT